MAAAVLAEHPSTYSQPGPEGLVFTSAEVAAAADRFATRTAWQPGRPEDGGGVANEAPNRSLVFPAVGVIVPPPGSRFAERPASGGNGS